MYDMAQSRWLEPWIVLGDYRTRIVNFLCNIPSENTSLKLATVGGRNMW